MDITIFTRQATLIKALSNPTRLEIVHILRHHVLTVSQIIAMLGVSQSVVSQHLASLKKSGIVASKREGKELYYTVADARILTACDAIRSLVTEEPLAIIPEPEVIDPVCGMDLTTKTAAASAAYNGVRHYFCATGCLKEFNTNPGHYVR
jgi:DNA-binding transcriptional ArsR family regulator/YHS domain-containing protein